MVQYPSEDTWRASRLYGFITQHIGQCDATESASGLPEEITPIHCREVAIGVRESRGVNTLRHNLVDVNKFAEIEQETAEIRKSELRRISR